MAVFISVACEPHTLDPAIACDAIVLSACQTANCVCSGSGGILLIVTNSRSEEPGRVQAQVSRGCMVERIRVNRALRTQSPHSETAQAGGISVNHITVMYKCLPVFDLVHPIPLDKTMLLFCNCPATRLDPNSFSATSHVASELAEISGPAQGSLRVRLLIQPPNLSTLEQAITAALPGEPEPPNLWPMDGDWALGGSLAQSAIRLQRKLWRQQDEGRSATPAADRCYLPQTSGRGPRSMANLFRIYAFHQSQERP